MEKVWMCLLLRQKIDVEKVMELDSAKLHLEICTQSNVVNIVKSHYSCEWNSQVAVRTATFQIIAKECEHKLSNTRALVKSLLLANVFCIIFP